MNTRDRAIEAAAKALHADDCGCADFTADPFYPPVARLALAAGVRVLLTELADEIEGGQTAYMPDGADHCERTANIALRDAAELVRAAAEGWGQ